MAFDFADKRVLVCGGSRGIGRSTALAFARAGASVAICARNPDALEATRAELAAFGRTAYAAPCDLADASAIARFVVDAADQLGGIDVLVNNASGFGMTDDVEGWTKGFNVDVMAIVHASRAALPFLEAASPRGSIVSVTSISAMRASTRSAPYGAVKAAAIHYTASLAAMLGAKGIRVNAVAPGSIEFPGGTWEQRREEGSPIYTSIRDRIPAKRLGEPDEVADVVLFLASHAARWVTGQTIVVDGGQLLFG